MVVKIFTRPTAKAKKIASATAGAILLAIQCGSLAFRFVYMVKYK